MKFVDPRSNQFGPVQSLFRWYRRRNGHWCWESLLPTCGLRWRGRARRGPLTVISARNVFHGPGILNTDLSISKRMRITEHQALVFRGEAFNFFNHGQFFNPGNAANLVDIASPSFGQIIYARDPRLVQLSLHYTF